MDQHRPGASARRGRRCRRPRGAAAVELALTLPVILGLLVGLWETARITQIQQVLLNAAREGARQASTGQLNDAAVKQVTLQYLKVALNDTGGTMTQNAVVAVANLTHPGRDATAADSLDLLQVTIAVPFKDVRWTTVKLTTGDATMITSKATWVSLVDVGYPTTAPQPPEG
jgi:Flp pilus assembly protein TadG